MALYNGVELSDLVLRGEEIELRPWRPEDLEPVYQAMSDPAMHRFLFLLPDPYTRQDAEQYVTSAGHEGRGDGTGVGSAIVETATGRVVGSAALRFPALRRSGAELGYLVFPAAQRHGYASQACRIYADWAFANGFDRVELFCTVDNVASARTAMSAGFRFEGVQRQAIGRVGNARDSATFGRLATDSGEPTPSAFPPLPEGGIGDGVVSLRVLTADDVDALLDEDDPVARGWAFDPTPRSREVTAERAARAGLDWLVGTQAPMAIVDSATGEVAGSITLRHPGPPGVGGIGYALRPSFRGRGLTSRALRILGDWALDQGGYARLELGAKTRNVASQRAAATAGFAADGVRAARLRNGDGSFADEVRYQLISRRVRRDG